MAAGRAPTAAFLPSDRLGPRRAPSRVQLLVMLLTVALVAAAFTTAAYVVKPNKARAFNLVYGSVLINDDVSPVSIDLASGKPTVRLSNAFTAVSAKASGDLDVVPLADENTLMLNVTTGEFNMVDNTGFVVKTTGGGVGLPTVSGSTSSSALAAGSSAYVLRTGATSSSIYLVGQQTVAAAIGEHAQAKARAYASIAEPVADVVNPAATADGELWLLTGTGTGSAAQSTIRQLSVPAESNAGVTLVDTSHGSVAGVAAVAAATRNPDGSGGAVTAVASADAIRVFSAGASSKLGVRIAGTVDDIRAATNAQGALEFLYHSATSGWYVVSAPTSGVGSTKISRVSGIDAAAALVTPAESNGALYTMDTRGSGALWQVDTDGSSHAVTGVTHYPTLKIEHSDLAGAEVVANGNRVIFDARANDEAAVAFSDGSHPAQVIDKHAAVAVDPTGATALADAHSRSIVKPGKTTPTKSTTPPTPRPAQELNDKVDCKTTTQNPNIATVQLLSRGSRSVSLQWTYPLLQPTDCAPSTYTVTTKVLTQGAPSAPSTVTVQGQNGVTLTHLFPDTKYELTVTAYLNGRGTASTPIRVATGPEGPAAPTGISATPDSSGNWTVSWNSCGDVAQGCVPSASWTVIATVCDGRGLSNVPAVLTVPADPTVQRTSAVYPGSDALLGRGLCFQVQGVGTQGTVGAVSAATAPVYSWRAPVAADLVLTASQPPNTSLGGTATTTVDIDLGANPTRDVGGVGATVQFQLTGSGSAGGTKSKTVTYDGSSTHLSTVFTGIEAGAQYTAAAVISPPRHPAAAVTTASVPVTTRADWPALSLSASCSAGTQTVVLSCPLTVQIAGLDSAQAGDERFDLADNSQVVCGSAGFALAKTGFDPGSDEIGLDVDLLTYSGLCTVTLALVEDSATGTKIFGGTTSPTVTTTVNLGQASTLDAAHGDFDAAWDTTDGSAHVTYSGLDTDDQVSELTDRWTEQLTAPDGTACGSAGALPTHAGIFIDVDPASCVTRFGAQTGWGVTVSYYDTGTSTSHSYSYTLSGYPPGYVAPCVVHDNDFSATWIGTADDPQVSVQFSGDEGDLTGCGNTWTYQLSQPLANDSCSSATGDPSADGVVIDAQQPCVTDPALPDWAVVVNYTDSAHNAQNFTVIVQGSPPAAANPPPGTGTPTP